MVTIVWIESVRSSANHTMNVAARAAPKTTVVVTSETPRLSVRLSVMRVPTMLMSTTASQ